MILVILRALTFWGSGIDSGELNADAGSRFIYWVAVKGTEVTIIRKIPNPNS